MRTYRGPMSTSLLQVLHPAADAGRILTSTPDESALRSLYSWPKQRANASAVVRASMVATVDGSAWGADGLSGSIHDDADSRVFAVVRSTADAVVVGAGTVRAEGYEGITLPDGLRAVREAEGRDAVPQLAIVSHSVDIPERVLDTNPIIVTGPVGAHRWGSRRTAVVDPADGVAGAIAALAALGLVRLVVEGGPHLLGDAVVAGVVDDLCVTTSGLITAGSAGRITASDTGISQPLALHHLILAGSTLIARWVVLPN